MTESARSTHAREPAPVPRELTSRRSTPAACVLNRWNGTVAAANRTAVCAASAAALNRSAGWHFAETSRWPAQPMPRGRPDPDEDTAARVITKNIYPPERTGPCEPISLHCNPAR